MGGGKDGGEGRREGEKEGGRGGWWEERKGNLQTNNPHQLTPSAPGPLCMCGNFNVKCAHLQYMATHMTNMEHN